MFSHSGRKPLLLFFLHNCKQTVSPPDVWPPAACLSHSWTTCWTRGPRSWTRSLSSPWTTLCWCAGSAAGRAVNNWWEQTEKFHLFLSPASFALPPRRCLRSQPSFCPRSIDDDWLSPLIPNIAKLKLLRLLEQIFEQFCHEGAEVNTERERVSEWVSCWCHLLERFISALGGFHSIHFPFCFPS